MQTIQAYAHIVKVILGGELLVPPIWRPIVVASGGRKHVSRNEAEEPAPLKPAAWH